MDPWGTPQVICFACDRWPLMTSGCDYLNTTQTTLKKDNTIKQAIANIYWPTISGLTS